MSDVFNWGIIGPGNIAHEFVKDLQLIQNVSHRVIAVLGTELKEAENFLQDGSAKGYDNILEFLQHDNLDVVYIATPHPSHYRDVILCLEHKIPVLCEKPLGMNARQVNEMTETSKQNKTFLMEGMWIRFLPSIKRVIELLEKDTIGDIINIKSNLYYVAPKDENNRFFNPELGGGSLLDLGVYSVFLSLLLLGKPKEIQAHAKLSDKGIDEYCAAILSYESGSSYFLESSIVTQIDNTATVYGEKGKIIIKSQWNEKPMAIDVIGYDGKHDSFPCEWEGRGFQYEIQETYDCIRKGKIFSDKMDHQFSQDIAELMDKIRSATGIVYPTQIL